MHICTNVLSSSAAGVKYGWVIACHTNLWMWILMPYSQQYESIYLLFTARGVIMGHGVAQYRSRSISVDCSVCFARQSLLVSIRIILIHGLRINRKSLYCLQICLGTYTVRVKRVPTNERINDNCNKVHISCGIVSQGPYGWISLFK